MSTSIKNTALSMALAATSELPLPDPKQTVSVAREFEAYLLEEVKEQAVIERDQARARVGQLERELGDSAAWALRAVLKQAREGCSGLDRLRVESVVEVAAESIGVKL